MNGTITPDVTAVQRAVENSAQWFKITNANGSITYASGIDTFDTPELFFCGEELDAYDPRLRKVIDALMQPAEQMVNGAMVWHSFYWWKHPMVIPPEAHFEPADRVLPESVSFDSYSEPAFHMQGLHIHYIAYTLSRTACGLEYVASAYGRYATISHDWLDRVHPHWKLHYDAAIDLGFSYAEALLHIFTPVAAPETALSDLPDATLI